MSIISGNIIPINKISGSINKKSNVSGSIDKPETVYVQELQFKNHFEFPNIGESNKLYIAIDENVIYRYDETSHTYVCVGSNITAIQCTIN